MDVISYPYPKLYACLLTSADLFMLTVVCFSKKEVKSNLAEPPLNFSGCLAKSWINFLSNKGHWALIYPITEERRPFY